MQQKFLKGGSKEDLQTCEPGVYIGKLIEVMIKDRIVEIWINLTYWKDKTWFLHRLQNKTNWEHNEQVIKDDPVATICLD